MDRPRLTIGIPTLDRAEHLQHAIDSCLRQRVPVHILIADQGHTYETAQLLSLYADHDNVEHIRTDATCLWENWLAAAHACRTEFFAWLQDDDVIARAYAVRVIKAFDAFAPALHWQARCCVSPDRKHAVWWGMNGPMVALDMLDNIPEMWPGEIIPAAMFFGSWALSPGVAFRCGPAFNEALAALPAFCDLFNERLILAEMGSRGPWIADSILAGYWHHHGKNESYKQNADGSLNDQEEIMFACLDNILDRLPDWSDALQLWCRSRAATDIMNWLDKWGPKASRHSEALQAALRASLEGRVELVAAQDNGKSDHGGELVWR